MADTDLKKTAIPFYIYPLFLITATLFLLIFSISTSPLYPAYGSDSSMFLTMGRLLLEGKTPYLDFFDHKGPFLILIEALGQIFLSGKIGMFIFQIINLFVIQLIICRLSLLFLDLLNSCISVLLFFIFFSLTIDGGNMTEEFCLIPLFLTLYITVRNNIKSQATTISDALIIGFSFAFIFFIRPNNAGLVSACVIYIFIISLKNKDYKSLKNLIIYFSLVQILVALLLLLYFYCRGGIEDFVYANFLFNMKYIGAEEITYTPLYWKLNVIVIASLFVGSIGYVVKNKDCNLILLFVLILIFNVAVTNIGNGYIHYLTLLLPTLLLGYLLLMYVVRTFIKGRWVSYTLLFFFTAAMCLRVSQTYSPTGWVDVSTWVENYKKDGTDIMKDIPKDEYIRTYYYSIDPRFYRIMDLTPNYKYFVIQDFHSSFDKKIEMEINETLVSTNRPLWIVTQNKDISDFSSPTLETILNKDYQVYAENDTFVLYKAITD